MFVFGYGSLVSPESIESTLRHGIDRSTVEYARLRGWKRSWNVGSDKRSHPERTFRLADGSEFDGVTVVLDQVVGVLDAGRLAAAAGPFLAELRRQGLLSRSSGDES